MKLTASLIFVCVHSQEPCRNDENWIAARDQRLNCTAVNQALAVAWDRFNGLPVPNYTEPMCSESTRQPGCSCQVQGVYSKARLKNILDTLWRTR